VGKNTVSSEIVGKDKFEINLLKGKKRKGNRI
jgi:hypothetical protein